MKKDILYLSNPLYTKLVEIHDMYERQKIEGMSTDFSCKKYDKEMRDGKAFVCFDLSSDIKTNEGLFVSKTSYDGQLSFYLDEKQNIAFVSSLPKIGDVPCFGKDVAEKLKQIVSKEVDSSKTKIVLNPKIKYVATNRDALDVCPGIVDCKQIEISNTIIERYKKEEELLRKEIAEHKRRTDEHDERIGRVLAKKRSFFGLDPEVYANEKDRFFEELGLKMRPIYEKKLQNCKIHLEATKSKVLQLVEASERKREREKMFKAIVEAFEEMGIENFEKGSWSSAKEDQCSPLEAKVGFFKDYFKDTLWNSDLDEQLQERLEEKLEEDDSVARLCELMSQFFALKNRAEKYEQILSSDDDRFFVNVPKKTTTNILMFQPSFILKSVDTTKFSAHRETEFVMIKPGEEDFDIEHCPLHVFRNPKDKIGPQILSENNIFDAQIIIVTIPKSLNYYSLKKFVERCVSGQKDEYSRKSSYHPGRKLYFVCEDIDTPGIVKRILKNFDDDCFFHRNDVWICVDKNYYNQFFLSMPEGESVVEKLRVTPHEDYIATLKRYYAKKSKKPELSFDEFLDTENHAKYIRLGDGKYVEELNVDVSFLKPETDYKAFSKEATEILRQLYINHWECGYDDVDTCGLFDLIQKEKDICQCFINLVTYYDELVDGKYDPRRRQELIGNLKYDIDSPFDIMECDYIDWDCEEHGHETKKRTKAKTLELKKAIRENLEYFGNIKDTCERLLNCFEERLSYFMQDKTALEECETDSDLEKLSF